MAVVCAFSVCMGLVLKLLNNEITNPNQRANMDVPLALNDIGIRYGLKGYIRKSSTFSLQTDVVGLSA